jgi:hypothetical protein
MSALVFGYSLAQWSVQASKWLSFGSVSALCKRSSLVTPYCKPWGCAVAGNVPHLNESNPVKVNQALRDLFAGRSNAVGTVTLTANVASTTVAAINCGKDSRVFLMPTTANASAEFGNGTIRISSVGSASFTITHANNAQTDRTFFWVALG